MDQQELELSPHALEAIRDGQYTLLLGAGAYIGATSSSGQPLPNAQAFAEELAKAFPDGHHAGHPAGLRLGRCGS